MKQTVLQLVQKILYGLDADPVNSIYDTFESEQVAQAVQDAYDDIIGRRFWPHLNQLLQFENSNDLTKPTHMKIPVPVQRINFVNYDASEPDETRRKYQPMRYQEPDEFLRNTNQRNNDEENITLVTDFSGVELLIRNDQRPRYWTSFDDEYIIFDSWDLENDDTIVASKMQAQAYVEPQFLLEDDFIPDLPASSFPLLLNEAKSQASIDVKQMANEKAEARARKHDRWDARSAWRAAGGVRYPDFGRRRGRGRYKRQPLDKNNTTPTN